MISSYYYYFGQVTHADFKKAKDKVMFKKKEGVPEGLYMWNTILYHPRSSCLFFNVLVMRTNDNSFVLCEQMSVLFWRLWISTTILIQYSFLSIPLILEIVPYSIIKQLITLGLYSCKKICMLIALEKLLTAVEFVAQLMMRTGCLNSWRDNLNIIFRNL